MYRMQRHAVGMQILRLEFPGAGLASQLEVSAQRGITHLAGQ